MKDSHALVANYFICRPKANDLFRYLERKYSACEEDGGQRCEVFLVVCQPEAGVVGTEEVKVGCHRARLTV